MRNIGRVFLQVSRALHAWHKVHMPLALFLVILSLGLSFLSARHLLSQALGPAVGEIEHFLHVFGIAFFGAYVSLRVTAAVVSWTWPVPFLPILTGLPDLFKTPIGSHWTFGDYFSTKYRYRFAVAEDLTHFVRFSLDDPAIVMANPEFGQADRMAVYTKWHELDRRFFMLLEVQATDCLEWHPAAVSIVLPLSRLGYQAVWAGALKIVDLEREHLAVGRRPTAVLIDTLIAQRRLKGHLKEILFGLPKLHVTRFWIPSGRKRMEVWVEPDHRKLPRILTTLGFEGPHSTSPGHALFRLALPPMRLQYTARQIATLAKMIDDLKECSRWVVM